LIFLQYLGTNDDLPLQNIADCLLTVPTLSTQRSCSIDDEKTAQTLTTSTSMETNNESTLPERVCLVPILTNLLELVPYALKFTSTLSTSNHDSISSSSLQSLNLSSTILTKYENHALYVSQSSHEYFQLLTSIIDRMHYDEIKQIKINKDKLVNQSVDSLVSISFDHEFIEILMNFIHEHVPYETQRDKFIEDEVLFGLICLLTSIVRQYNHSSLKHADNDEHQSYTRLTLHLIDRVFKYLFELPTSDNRCVPKCKSLFTRAKSYEFLNELIKINRDNFIQLQRQLLEQHNSIDRQQPYVWDYWPRDDGRSYSGYVGLTNLGATCYAATSIQHLYMIPELRVAILNANRTGKHDMILYELKRMFAYLLESERRSYNPKSFCKVYTMDGLQSLNTGDQKDMTEFFTDLITKLEEMSDDLKRLVRELFCGTLTNIVLSFDCPHISRKLEEFYTVRCQVADMKDVHESLAELTVKDTLEGDNMYTCSKCARKVRAEKRVCFRKLPKILCLNTMRYTFNMVTMQREKVNTLFQFPMQLDMSGYMETNLIDRNKLIRDDNPATSDKDDTDDDDDNNNADDDNDESSNRYPSGSPSTINESHLFELIGVTVHTGTAEGGHYYSFIRERVKRASDVNPIENLLDSSSQGQQQQHRWYLFNDAEVKQFDPSQIANECFGGDVTSKGYDQSSDRVFDFQFEKTHSAYMLFYERIDSISTSTPLQQSTTANAGTLQLKDPIAYSIPKDISDWIWEDNRRFVRDRHLFDHNYFTFMWMLCHHQVTTSNINSIKPNDQESSDTLTTQSYDMLPIQLAITFVFETYIHAKDKPTMAGWVEYLCKQFTACKPVATWFLAHMTQDETWLTKVLVRCPNLTIRQMFERVLIDVLHKSRFRYVDYCQSFLFFSFLLLKSI
jgi:ubiquitin carboxyl-terminal hydrolase 34